MDDGHARPSVLYVMMLSFVSCCDGHAFNNHMIVAKLVALPHVLMVK